MVLRRAILLTAAEGPLDLPALADSAGIRLERVVQQRLPRPDPRSFLGAGKLREVRKSLDEPGLAGVELVLVAGVLKPGQVLRLQKELGREAWDRVRVILAIFEERARSREAQAQVELARMQWELPLVKEAIHLQKKGERPGFQAGGEMAFSVYEEHVKRRTAVLRERLEGLARDRRARAEKRPGHMHLALAGFTNAGKTTLLNALTGAREPAEGRLFSTLETRTRAVKLPGLRNVLLTDTVGFVEDLPPWLVEAFQATLEEVVGSDVVVLAVDASEPLDVMSRKAAEAGAVLQKVARGAGVAPAPIVVALTKADRCLHGPDALAAVGPQVGSRAACPVSASKGTGLESLVRACLDAAEHRSRLELEVPVGAGNLLDQLQKLGASWSVARNGAVGLELWAARSDETRIRAMVAHAR